MAIKWRLIEIMARFENGNNVGKDTQFQEGNTAAVGHGRPEIKILRTILKNLGDSMSKISVEDKHAVDEYGNIIKELSLYEAMALRLYNAAASLDNNEAIKAILAIRDIVEGKLTDKVEQKNEYVNAPEDEAIMERYNQQQFDKRINAMSKETLQALIEDKEVQNEDI